MSEVTQNTQGMGTISIAELKYFIENVYASPESSYKPRPIGVMGKAGIGKTEAVQAMAKELGIGFKEVILSVTDPMDLNGIAHIVENTGDKSLGIDLDGPEENRLKATFIRTDMLPDMVIAEQCVRQHLKSKGIEDTPENRRTMIDIHDMDPKCKERLAGILFFDEVTSAPEQARIAVAKLLDASRGFNNYTLPDRWLIIWAGNGPDDGGLYNGIEGMFLNRSNCFRMEPDLPGWLEWASDHNIFPEIKAFLQSYPEEFWHYDYNAPYTPIFPSPRSWTNASKELHNHQENIKKFRGRLTHISRMSKDVLFEVIPKNIARAALTGQVSEVCADKFLTFCEFSNAIVPFDEIAKNGINTATNVNDSAREILYLQANITSATFLRFFSEYQESTLSSTGKRPDGTPYLDKLEYEKRIQNVLRWAGKVACTNLDLGAELIRQILQSGTLSQKFLQFLLSRAEDLDKWAPEFMQYYQEHASLYNY